MSIRREFAKKIFSGTKKYEFRRTIFKNPDVDTVVVYASGAGGAVVGQFQIDRILHEDLDTLWSIAGVEAGISEDSFANYFAHRQDGYAIRIKDATAYEPPLSLGDFDVHFAPQSFRYL